MVMEPASALAVMMAPRWSRVSGAMATDPQPPWMGIEDEVKRAVRSAFVEHEGFAFGAGDGDDVAAMAG